MSASGRRTRLALGLRAALAAVLALGAAALAIDLGDWSYVRFDLTARHSNTLDPAVLDVLDRLPEPVVIDAFLRPLIPPYAALHAEAAEWEESMGVLPVHFHLRRRQISSE